MSEGPIAWKDYMKQLEDFALLLAASHDRRLQCSNDSLFGAIVSASNSRKIIIKCTHLIKDVLQAFLCQCRAFNVLNSSKFPSKPLSLFWSDRPLLLSRKFFYYLRIIPQIDLCAYDEARNTGTMMVDFREPFLLDVLKWCRGRDTEANQENVGLGIGQWTKAIVILLT